MTIAGPGGTKIFFSDPPSGTVFAPGSLVVGRGAATMARGALETGKPGDIAKLHFCLFPPKLLVVLHTTYMSIDICRNSYVGIPSM